MKDWKEIVREIDITIRPGIEISKTDGGLRPVTRIVNDKIYVRTGVKTNAEKYTTKDMIRFAYQTMVSDEYFDYNILKNEFPKECKQGACVDRRDFRKTWSGREK